MKIFSDFFKWIKKRLVKYRCGQCSLHFPINCKVHGVTLSDRQGALAQSRRNDELQLVHVSLDKYPHNVYVYAISIHRILGYLDEGLSRKLIYVFGEGFCLDGKISDITGGGYAADGSRKLYFGCNIEIYDTAVMMLPYLKGDNE